MEHLSDEQALKSILESLAAYHISARRISLTKTILGRGGFGVVVLGEMGRSSWKRKKGTLVAVKQLQATGNTMESRKVALALMRELQVWAGLAHPHIVPLVGFCLSENLEKAWLISPYMKGGNIRDYLRVHKPDMTVRLRMFGEVASGITYLHCHNLCHGDIKGANVLVDDAGQAKLCDFGLTILMETGTAGGMTSTGLKGTTRYMAPEFYHEERPVRTKKSDVWAWSCLGIEVVFDRIPYDDVTVDWAIMTRIMQGDPPLNLDDIDVNDSVKLLFKRCWVVQPLDRIDIKTCATILKTILDTMQAQTVGQQDQEQSTDRTSAETGTSSTIHVGVSDVKKTHENSAGSPEQANKRVDSIIGLSSQMMSRGAYAQGRKVARYRQALSLQSGDHPERHNNLHNLAVSLLDNYRKERNIADLYEAIDFNGQALFLRQVGHPERHHSLYCLAISLWEKYRKEGDTEDLYKAIDLDYQALLLRPGGHPERHNSLHNIAVSLLDKYSREGAVADLYGAIDFDRQALTLRPLGNPERPHSLYSLAIALLDKYRVNGEIADLDEAIDLHRQTLDLLSLDHSRYQSTQVSLEILLEMRSNATRNATQGVAPEKSMEHNGVERPG